MVAGTITRLGIFDADIHVVVGPPSRYLPTYESCPVIRYLLYFVAIALNFSSSKP